MEKTLQVLNDLERAGVVRHYAIGGAMGATFYIEPVLDRERVRLLREQAALDREYLAAVLARHGLAL